MAQERRNSASEKRAESLTKQDHLHNRRILRILGVIIIVTIAFSAGFMIRNQTEFMASLGFPINEAQGSAASTADSSYDSISARVADVQSLLADSSLDSYDITTATNSMLTDLMTSTGDPYAAYFNPDRYGAYVAESTTGAYYGIGVLFADYNGRAYVSDVFSGSEAEAKGVQQGDFIVEIDGVGDHPWSMAEVINTLSLDEGQEITIKWMRPVSLDAETGQEFTTTLLCRNYEAVNVTAEIMDGVGVVTLRQITANASELVSDAVTSLVNQGATAFVLDVRNNPGGFLTQAIDVSSLFLNSGVIVGIQTKEGTSSRSASGITLTSAPMVVLANNYTAAAAEVIVGALKDNQRATFVGQTTLGKGSVQVVRELDFGGAIRYTAAYYLTPLGQSFNGLGISPDISVSQSSDLESDTQLQVAVDTAASMV